MNTTIQTTTGIFPIEKLENVLMHEHIVLGYAGWFYDPRCAEFNHAVAEQQTLDRLKKLRDRGVNLVVDPCPIELGRNPAFMQEMSAKSGVQIMCSTGFDLEARGCSYFCSLDVVARTYRCFYGAIKPCRLYADRI